MIAAVKPVKPRRKLWSHHTFRPDAKNGRGCSWCGRREEFHRPTTRGRES